MVIVAQAAALVGIVPQPKTRTGRLVRTYAGAREKSGGSSEATTSQAWVQSSPMSNV